MATELRGTLAREVKIGDTSYKVELSATGLRLTEKRKRRSAEISCQTLVALGNRDATRPAERDTAVVGNSAVSADVAKEIRTATKALERAGRSSQQRAVSQPCLCVTSSLTRFTDRWNRAKIGSLNLF